MTPQDVALLAVLIGALWVALVAWGLVEWATRRLRIEDPDLRRVARRPMARRERG